jgi:NAD(P)-dependent dehydrogenase (short-subunit alcohol dehydrogenase family)
LSFAHYPSLQDRVVLITGGGSGIGGSMTEAFAGQGARVAFLDIDEAASTALTDRLAHARHRPLFIHCDLTDIAALRDAIARVRAQLGPVAVLINNAANETARSP